MPSIRRMFRQRQSLRGRLLGQLDGLPAQQLLVLALCRICEPIAFMSIFPYIYQMIQSFGVAKSKDEIAVYAGLVTSAFAFAECSTGVIWGRISDRIGRKSVLIGGLVGTALSMILFGFATSLPVALLARALGGLLNGNIGVLQTVVAELVTAKEQQPRAYSIMPFIWCLGSIIGPALGGALAQPCESIPWLFSKGTIWDRYPFLLPNLVCTIVLLWGIVIGILFLEETHAEKKHRRDIGLEAGRWVTSFFARKPQPLILSDKAADATLDEIRSLLEDDLPPGYRTSEGSPRLSSTRARTIKDERQKPVKAARKAFTKQVIVNIVAYGVLAFHTMSFDQLMPIFLSTDPAPHSPISLPFKFTGGFGFSAQKIGVMLSFQAIYSMFAQLIIFPFVVRQLGPLRTFRCIYMVWPLLYFLVPYLVMLPATTREIAVFLCLLWRSTAQVHSYPANAILLANAAPSTMVLGVINGVAASTTSLCRAFGPTISGMIHSWGLKQGYTGLAWWVGGLVCAIGAIETLWMEEGEGIMDLEEEIDDEAALSEPLIDPLAIDAAILTATLTATGDQSGKSDDE